MLRCVDSEERLDKVPVSGSWAAGQEAMSPAWTITGYCRGDLRWVLGRGRKGRCEGV